MKPRTGTASSIKPIDARQWSTPRTKLAVPSIGSMTQSSEPFFRSRPPRQETSRRGRRGESSATIISSVARSASVTKSCSPFRSTGSAGGSRSPAVKRPASRAAARPARWRSSIACLSNAEPPDRRAKLCRRLTMGFATLSTIPTTAGRSSRQCRGKHSRVETAVTSSIMQFVRQTVHRSGPTRLRRRNRGEQDMSGKMSRLLIGLGAVLAIRGGRGTASAQHHIAFLSIEPERLQPGGLRGRQETRAGDRRDRRECFDGEFNADKQFSQVEDVVTSGKFDGMIILPDDSVGSANAVEDAVKGGLKVETTLFRSGRNSTRSTRKWKASSPPSPRTRRSAPRSRPRRRPSGRGQGPLQRRHHHRPEDLSLRRPPLPDVSCDPRRA